MTIYQTGRQQILEQKWAKKQEELSKNKKSQRELTQEERMLKDFQERCEEERENNAHAGTYTKLESGGELTQDEIDYLEKNNPEALAKYRQAQAEKKAYSEKLRHCKTKEEVERVKQNKVCSYLSQAKKITNNPYIPKGQKCALLKELNNKLCMIEEAHAKFTKSSQYKELPKESEIQKERAEETKEQTEEMAENVQNSVEEKEELAEDNNDAIEKLSTETEEKTCDIMEESEEDKIKKVRKDEPDVHQTKERPDRDRISFKQVSMEFRQMVRALGHEESPRSINVSI